MTSVDETPAMFYRYFEELVMTASPSSRDWTPGFQAAQLWKRYHDTLRTTPALLQEIIEILMPHRYDGSGFLGLWGTVLSHIRTLPVDVQIVLWRDVFDQHNHGDRPLLGAEQAQSVLTLWYSTWARPTDNAVVEAAISAIVEALYPHLLAADEWRALIFAIDHWIQQVQPQRPLLDRVVERHNAVKRAE